MFKLLLPSTVSINGVELDFDLEEDTQIDLSSLEMEATNQATRFAKYATAFAISEIVEKRLKMELEALSAKIDVRTRMEAKQAQIKLTEKMAEHTVKGSKEYLEKNEELLQAQEITGLLKQAKDAMIHKRDMLVQLIALKRQEQGSDISMKADFVRKGSS